MARKTTKKSASAKGKAGAAPRAARKVKGKAGAKPKTKGKAKSVAPKSLTPKRTVKSAQKSVAKGRPISAAKSPSKSAARSPRAAAKHVAARPQAKSGTIDATRRRASAATPVMARKPVAPRAKTAGGARPHVPALRPAAKRAPSAIFAEAVERAMQGYLFDAVSLFRDVVESEPRGPLADDALFNIGTALLQMRMVTDAEAAFTELIEKYPESTIDAVYNGNEHGRTAAKALLGRMQARLAQGKFDDAKADREALASYDDSWVTDPGGNRKSFRELAVAVMP